MFILQLNPMKAGENDVSVVARAESPEELIKLMEQEKVPQYQTDGRWVKVFRQGGPLEWFNAPLGEAMPNGVPYILDIGTADVWAEQARVSFENEVMAVPTVESLTHKTVQL